MTAARRIAAAAIVMLAALAAACGSAPRRDLDFDRLQARIDELAADPDLSRYAVAERALAESMLRRLDVASGKEHAQLVYVAERRVDIAYMAAQTARESEQLAQLERDLAALMLEASRRETAAARDELDRQRREELVRIEEAARAAAIAASAAAQPPIAPAPVPPAAPAPAAPPPAVTETPLPPPAPTDAPPQTTLVERLAVIAPEVGLRGAQMTLEDLVFEPGQAKLREEAGVGLGRVLAFVERDAQRGIRIEGHTDATGSVEANRDLSLRRAEAVRDALVARGVAPERIQVFGLGESDPVASNDEAEGRALNRRVVIVLESPPAAPGGA